MAAEASVRAILRAATRDEHSATELAVSLAFDLRQRSGYVDFLARCRGFYVPLEADLQSVEGLEAYVPDLPHRWKASWIEADLRALGLDDRDLANFPHCTRLPRTTSVPRALGILYVLEGATLGGEVLTRRVAQELRTPATRFLTSYGVERKLCFEIFTHGLDRLLDPADPRDALPRAAHPDTLATRSASANDGPSAHEERIEQAAEAARETFVRFRDWMTEIGVA